MPIRLVNTATLQLELFDSSAPPEYAILSHTWDPGNEVSFLEMTQPSGLDHATVRKPGYQKIVRTCELAWRQGIAYVWVDTCSIDRASSAELSEAINSMFRWYERARVCYAYLSDLPAHAALDTAMRGCRWFTRGWCLQELVAPKQLEFYNREWGFVGTKLTLRPLVASISKVDEDVLVDSTLMYELPVARRMSWASMRTTTRTEDIAYCLLGIFDVNMPMLYGEGSRAFLRLQEEIIRRSNDLSIFFSSSTAEKRISTPTRLLTRPRDDNSESENEGRSLDSEFDMHLPYRDLFAQSPRAFIHGGSVVHSPHGLRHVEFSLTNNGVHFPDAKLVLVRLGTVRRRYKLLLRCFKNAESRNECEMALRKVGPARFVRLRHSFLRFQADHSTKFEKDSYTYAEEAYVLATITPSIHMQLDRSHHSAIRIRSFGNFMARALQDAVPRELWDVSKQEFLTLEDESFEGHIRVFPHLIEDVNWVDREDEDHFYLACGLNPGQTAWVRLYSLVEWKRFERRMGRVTGFKYLREDKKPLRTTDWSQDSLYLGMCQVRATIRFEKGPGGPHCPHFLVHVEIGRPSRFSKGALLPRSSRP